LDENIILRKISWGTISIYFFLNFHSRKIWGKLLGGFYSSFMEKRKELFAYLPKKNYILEYLEWIYWILTRYHKKVQGSASSSTLFLVSPTSTTTATSVLNGDSKSLLTNFRKLIKKTFWIFHKWMLKFSKIFESSDDVFLPLCDVNVTTRTLDKFQIRVKYGNFWSSENSKKHIRFSKNVSNFSKFRLFLFFILDVAIAETTGQFIWFYTWKIPAPSNGHMKCSKNVEVSPMTSLCSFSMTLFSFSSITLFNIICNYAASAAKPRKCSRFHYYLISSNPTIFKILHFFCIFGPSDDVNVC